MPASFPPLVRKRSSRSVHRCTTSALPLMKGGFITFICCTCPMQLHILMIVLRRPERRQVSPLVCLRGCEDADCLRAERVARNNRCKEVSSHSLLTVVMMRQRRNETLEQLIKQHKHCGGVTARSMLSLANHTRSSFIDSSLVAKRFHGDHK